MVAGDKTRYPSIMALGKLWAGQLKLQESSLPRCKVHFEGDERVYRRPREGEYMDAAWTGDHCSLGRSMSNLRKFSLVISQTFPSAYYDCFFCIAGHHKS